MPLLDSAGAGGASRRYQFMGSNVTSATLRGLNLTPNVKRSSGELLAPFNPLFWGSKQASFPAGTRLGNYLVGPVGDGGLASMARASSSAAGGLAATGVLSAAPAGSSSVSASPNRGAQLTSSLLATSALSGAIGATGNLSAAIEVGARPSAQDIADAVWSRNLAPFDDAGTAGLALTGAGAAGNPWTADLASNNTPGTFGAFVQKLLTAAKFLGLK